MLNAMNGQTARPIVSALCAPDARFSGWGALCGSYGVNSVGHAVLNKVLDAMVILQVEVDAFQQAPNKLADQRDVRTMICSTSLAILRALTRVIIVQEPDDPAVRGV